MAGSKASLLADITPLRRSRHFRRLWLGLSVSGIGNQLTVVAVSVQAYLLTGSTFMVGLIGLVQLAPTLIGSLGGGALADAADRRRVLVVAQLMLAATSVSLAVNAMLPHPRLWVLFVASGAAAAFQGLDYPTRLAILPMLLEPEDLSAGFALQSVVTNTAMVVGPALAGLLIAKVSIGAVFVIDACSYGAVLTAALLLPALPVAGGGTPMTFRSVLDGIRFVRAERLLLASFGIDLIAMTFGMPKAVFPALGLRLYHGGATAVGLLYAAPGAGALLGSLVSGWAAHAAAKARALVLCMLVWGASITVLGVVPVLWVGLVMLALAGLADTYGTVFRVSILQQTTPEHMQGRLGGLFFAAAVAGNRLGDGESGVAAAIGGPQFAVWSGGLACIVGTVLTVWRVPLLWRRPAEEPAVVAAVS